MGQDFSDRIRELRKQQGLSQTQLAQRAGISQQHLSRIERGGGGIELRTLEAVLRALGRRLELAPAPPAGREALLARRRQWERFERFERELPEPASAARRLAQVGQWVALFASLHPNAPYEPLQDWSEGVRKRREALSVIKLQ